MRLGGYEMKKVRIEDISNPGLQPGGFNLITN